MTLNPEVSAGGDPEIRLAGIDWGYYSEGEIQVWNPPVFATLGSFDVVGVPEPSSVALAAIAVLTAGGLRRRLRFSSPC